MKTPLLALAAVAALTLACSSSGSGGDTPPPVVRPSQEAGIQNIAVSRGTLSPAYNKQIDNYGVSLSVAAADMDVTVTLVDAKAKLTINGQSAQSGVPRRIALGEWTVVNILAVAEDGITDNLVRLTVKVAKPNTKVWVLDSFGGTYPDGAKLTLTDTSGAVLASDIDLPAEKNGSPVFSLDPNGRYNIYAKANGSAQACFANFDPSREDTATLYCLPNWAASLSSEAPVITDIHFSSQANANWAKLPDGSNTLETAAAMMQYVKVTARAKAAITESDWGPDPMNIMLDSPAWYGNATLGVADETAKLVGDGGQMYYQSTYRFRVPYMQNVLAEKNHWLDIVVYDVANNRTETRVYLTVNDSAASLATDPSLAQESPKTTTAQGQTYGMSLDMPAINPVDSYGAFYYTSLTFSISDRTYNRQMTDYWDEWMGVDPLDMIDLSGIDLPGIRGFEVWRSDGDDRNFRKIDTVHYAQLNRGLKALAIDMDNYWPAMVKVGQAFTYADVSPDVVEDTMYYKFRAFNGNPANDGQSPFSDTIAVKPLPPFTTRLAGPTNGEVVDSIWPTFRFQITNPAICRGGVSDAFYFTLYLKNTWYPDAALRMTYFADFANLNAKGGPRCYYYRDSGWSITLIPATVDGTPDGEPYLWMEPDGTFVLSTDNPGFKQTRSWSAEDLVPGLTYEWSIFGMDGGLLGDDWNNLQDSPRNAAHFAKTYQAPAGKRSDAYSFGSISLYGLGSPNGFFVFTVDPEADPQGKEAK